MGELAPIPDAHPNHAFSFVCSECSKRISRAMLFMMSSHGLAHSSRAYKVPGKRVGIQEAVHVTLTLCNKRSERVVDHKEDKQEEEEESERERRLNSSSCNETTITLGL